jgi:ATP adenylyltransferase/5',5'''-P-1,P-4-tetraphosphate phosphorylase II
MLMVSRNKPEIGSGISLNSLGFLGFLYAGDEEQKKEIIETKPIEIMK